MIIVIHLQLKYNCQLFNGSHTVVVDIMKLMQNGMCGMYVYINQNMALSQTKQICRVVVWDVRTVCLYIAHNQISDIDPCQLTCQELYCKYGSYPSADSNLYLYQSTRHCPIPISIPNQSIQIYIGSMECVEFMFVFCTYLGTRYFPNINTKCQYGM